MTDLAPSPNPLPTTERTLQDDIRHDRAYLAGLRAGWNLGIVNANDEFNGKVNSLVSELTDAAKGVATADAPTTEGATQGWQDIATAPKDGTKMLGFAPNKLISDPNFRVVTMWWRKWSDRDGDHWSWQSTETGSHVGDPTHWMPIPPPPGQ